MKQFEITALAQICASASVSGFSLKGQRCLEARYSALIAHRLNGRADALPTAFCKLHHLLLAYFSSSTSPPPPPPLYLSPPVVRRSLDLISPSQADGVLFALQKSICMYNSGFQMVVLTVAFWPLVQSEPLGYNGGQQLGHV